MPLPSNRPFFDGEGRAGRVVHALPARSSRVGGRCRRDRRPAALGGVRRGGEPAARPKRRAGPGDGRGAVTLPLSLRGAKRPRGQARGHVRNFANQRDSPPASPLHPEYVAAVTPLSDLRPMPARRVPRWCARQRDTGQTDRCEIGLMDEALSWRASRLRRLGRRCCCLPDCALEGSGLGHMMPLRGNAPNPEHR